MGRRRHRHSLRIIGGKHRGRKLPFIVAKGLRPTPDRVRETVFNWLQPVIAGARCLDMYAGSGAMGIEAASRGAAEVLFIDINREVCDQIQHNIRTLKLTDCTVRRQAAADFTKSPVNNVFDIVFLDPPYRDRELEKIMPLLDKKQRISQGGRIYMESKAMIAQPALPDTWQLTHTKQAGQVFYHLIQVI